MITYGEVGTTRLKTVTVQGVGEYPARGDWKSIEIVSGDGRASVEFYMLEETEWLGYSDLDPSVLAVNGLLSDPKVRVTFDAWQRNGRRDGDLRFVHVVYVPKTRAGAIEAAMSTFGLLWCATHEERGNTVALYYEHQARLKGSA